MNGFIYIFHVAIQCSKILVSDTMNKATNLQNYNKADITGNRNKEFPDCGNMLPGKTS